MIPAFVFAVALAVGFARGGRLSGLANLPLRAAPAILLLFVAQVVLREQAFGLRFAPSTLVWLWCGVSAGLVALCLLNWRIRGMPIVAVGIALNLAVVLLNSGMPAGGPLATSLGMSPSSTSIAARGGFYHLAGSGDVAVAIADVIPVPLPRPFRALVSIGDLLLFIGAGVVIEEGMRQGAYRARHSAS